MKFAEFPLNIKKIIMKNNNIMCNVKNNYVMYTNASFFLKKTLN